MSAPPARLPRATAAMLEEHQERCVECLRYFHGCYPLAKTGARERAARLRGVLEEQRTELLAHKASLPKDQPAMARLALSRINALLDMLNAAVHVHDHGG